MNKRQVTMLLLAGGVIGPLLFVLVFLIEGTTRPGYDAWRHFVSELSLSDQGWMQMANFIVCGLLILGFAIGLRRSLAPGLGSSMASVLLAITGISLLIAGLFVTDPILGYPPGTPSAPPQSLHGTIHGIAGLIVFLSVAFACFVLVRYFFHDAHWRGWAAYSILTGLLVLVFFFGSNVTAVLSATRAWPNAPTGLLQRVAFLLGWGWIALLALKLYREQRSKVSTASRSKTF